jgi:hypothetical protein
MRWNVEGADVKTGKNRLVQVYAKDSEEAEDKARKLGLLVSAVHESVMKPAVEPTDEEIDIAPPAVANHAAAGSNYESPQAKPLTPKSAPPRNDRDEARRRRAMIPEYAGLNVAAFVIGVFSTLYYVLGAIALVMALITAYSATSPTRFEGPTLAGYGLISLMAAGLMHGMSAGCYALRDIARNSFNV